MWPYVRGEESRAIAAARVNDARSRPAARSVAPLIEPVRSDGGWRDPPYSVMNAASEIRYYLCRQPMSQSTNRRQHRLDNARALRPRRGSSSGTGQADGRAGQFVERACAANPSVVEVDRCSSPMATGYAADGVLSTARIGRGAEPVRCGGAIESWTLAPVVGRGHKALTDPQPAAR